MNDLHVDPRRQAHRNDPATSHTAAAQAADHARATAIRRRVMSVFNAHRCDGLADFELRRLLPEHAPSVAQRRQNLRDDGLLADSGKTRSTATGSPATVWTITRDGVDWCVRWQVDEWAGARLAELGEPSGEQATAVRLAGECPLCSRQFHGRPGLNRHLRSTHKAVA